MRAAEIFTRGLYATLCRLHTQEHLRLGYAEPAPVRAPLADEVLELKARWALGSLHPTAAARRQTASSKLRRLSGTEDLTSLVARLSGVSAAAAAAAERTPAQPLLAVTQAVV